MFLVNGQPADSLQLTDRSIHFGDGLFETMLCKKGILQFWNDHYERLCEGCYRLHIPVPEQSLLETESRRLLDTVNRDETARVKLIISRGSGGTGYAPPELQQPARIFSWQYYQPLPDTPLRVGVSTVRLGEQPLLAGLKHLNRLEQVMARHEIQDSDLDEALMLDQHERVVEGISSNVFWFDEDVLCTPSLQRCGVAGIIRGRVIQVANKLGITVKEDDFSLNDAVHSRGLFLTNSLMGMRSAGELGGVPMHGHPLVAQLQHALEALR
jgi:4-amino-4-deoxychorismate lyase